MWQCKHVVPLLIAAAMLTGCQPASAPFACTDAIGCVDIAPGEPIQLGVMQALSGELADQGEGLLQCTELTLDDRDRELLGHRIELQVADSRCSGEGGTTATLQVVADPRIVAIMGPTCSGAAATAMKIVSEAGLVMVSSSSSSPSLTSIAGQPGADWQPGFFRTAQNDAVVGRVAATFAMEELGVTRAATIDDGDPYTWGLASTFQQVFGELGGQVVLAGTINKGDSDMRPLLTAVAASGAELLFFPVFRPEGDYIVLQAREMEEMANVVLMTAEGLYFESFVDAVGPAGTGMYFNSPVRPEGPAYDAFVARYTARYTEPSSNVTPYDAHMVDAVNILLHAIETVAVAEEDGTLHIGRQALRDALYAATGFEGLTGSLSCDQYGDCGVARFQVTRLDDPAAGLEGLAANVVYTYPPNP
jgi:branched-chain amino acid transport system substrate-binding protein